MQNRIVNPVSLFSILTYLSVGQSSAELVQTVFADASQTPSPAVIAAAPTGEVYVGLDMQGSLGTKIGEGKIVRLVDTNADGKSDKVTTFAKVDNPRGITILGDKVLVLHTVTKNGKYDNQQLSLFEDMDKNGVADGPPVPLVKNIGNKKFLQSRGADHSTNNIRYAIDGWIYISVGDFGFVNATGTDGNKLTLLGGGVARVRPDGSGFEIFMRGTRNVYDVAIDPFLNIFTRENTNDGIGWWARSSHYIQSADYGYPSLYTNFPEEILPAMGEYGSGSGTGALFLDEPTWPDEYNNSALLADWGHSKVYLHKVKPLGATFTNQVKEFSKTFQVSDLDIDGSGRIYLSAWDDAGYKGSDKKGSVNTIVPKGWKYKPFPVLQKLSDEELIEHIKSKSHTARVNASYELVSRKAAADKLLELVKDKNNGLASRVAAIYTFAQIKKEGGLSDLQGLFSDTTIREHVLRAMTDDLAVAKSVDSAFIAEALTDSDERVQSAAIIGLGRIGDASVASQLLALAYPPELEKTTSKGNAPVFTSKTLAKMNKKVFISANIENLSQLVLTVDELGQNKFDETAWIEPKIHLADGKVIDVTSLTPIKESMDRGSLGINKDCRGEELKFAKKKVSGIGVHARSEIVYEMPEGAKRFTAEGILTPGAKGPGKKIGQVSFTVGEYASKPVAEPGYIAPTVIKPHSTPRQNAVIPHLARKAIIALNAESIIAEAIKSEKAKPFSAALSVAKEMHSIEVVEALIKRTESSQGEELSKLIEVIARLHQKEKAYDGSTWWKTKPNPDGPYFTAVDWAGTKKINDFLAAYAEKQKEKQKITMLFKKQKAYVDPFNKRPKGGPKKQLIGDMAIEDVIVRLDKLKPNVKNGAKVITKVGCAGCHNTDAISKVKGPDLTKLGKMKNSDITAAIITPGASIATSWLMVTTKAGMAHIGTLVKEDKNEIILHDIAGQATAIKIADIQKRALGPNMMSLHLCDELTPQEFADLIAYMKSLDK